MKIPKEELQLIVNKEYEEAIEKLEQENKKLREKIHEFVEFEKMVHYDFQILNFGGSKMEKEYKQWNK